ncbi:MAG TPA: hypothetical protein VL995_12895 [Cellvibrio sp.]|nr:hypothetical protein [Cellvibrio sp.]
MSEENINKDDVTPEETVKPAKKKAAGQPKAKRTFPQHSIEECRKVADTIKQFNAGNPWSPKDIAASLQMGMSNNFFYLTAAARDYGITIGTRDTDKIELSELGRKLVYPKSSNEEAEAIQTSFKNVELFKKVFDYYQGENLPEIQYLKNTLKTEFGVSEEHQDDFHIIYQKNLNYLKSKGELLSSPSVENGSKIKATSIILGESTSSGTLVAFVAMPFSEKTSAYPKGYFDEVLKHLITPAAVKANFNARTAKKAGSEVIQSTIVNDLDAADLVIVDLTEHNPNVLFELGMRIAFNKPVCLIRARGTGAIFDIDHMLRVYDYNPCLWPTTLEIDVPALTEHITETWKNRDSERSYLSLLRDNK